MQVLANPLPVSLARSTVPIGIDPHTHGGHMANFAISKALSVSFDQALAAIPDALKTEGFGVLTQIEVDSVLRAKLGAEFRRYRILGACNPTLAHRALSANLLAGVMLPCNVVVWEGDDGKAQLAAIDPREAPAALADPAIGELAQEVYARLVRVVAALE
jgi:uncharacterized protein (DUF302 family)